MKDFNRLTTRLRQFGGWRLLWQYARMGVLWTGIKEFLKCLCNGRSVKSIYPIITQKIDKILISRYSPLINQDGQHTNDYPTDTEHYNKIWFCWLQGMNNAPELVHACYNSIHNNLSNDIIIITKDNYNNYVNLPDYIIHKYNKGIIPHPLFSDILRLELLIRYGGTWIDASVLCTGDKYWDAIQNSDLFLFRYFRNRKEIGISNWFIHAKPQNALLKTVRNMLFAYWRDYNCTIEYYIFHLFFTAASRQFPDIMQAMPRGNSFACLQLGNHITHSYDINYWQKITTDISFHKLNYRLNNKKHTKDDSFYNYIINTYARSE